MSKIMSKNIKNTELIQGVDFELIQNLPNNGTKYLLIFDDPFEEICSSKELVKIANAGRHKGLSTMYTKHNLFHQSRLGRDIELQNTHTVLFKSPRDVKQINTLSQQLRLGSQLRDWYTTLTSVPYGHLLIDLAPKTVDSLRYCTSSGSTPSLFFPPQSRQQIIFLNDEHTTSLYSDRVPEIFPQLQNNFPQILPQRLHRVSKRVHSKPFKRRAKRNSKTSFKVQRRNSSAYFKKN